MVIRANKAKTKSPEAAIGEIVTVKGFMSKLMRIGKFSYVFWAKFSSIAKFALMYKI
jgi:hypothetical protein